MEFRRYKNRISKSMTDPSSSYYLQMVQFLLTLHYYGEIVYKYTFRVQIYLWLRQQISCLPSPSLCRCHQHKYKGQYQDLSICPHFPPNRTKDYAPRYSKEYWIFFCSYMTVPSERYTDSNIVKLTLTILVSRPIVIFKAKGEVKLNIYRQRGLESPAGRMKEVGRL